MTRLLPRNLISRKGAILLIIDMQKNLLSVIDRKSIIIRKIVKLIKIAQTLKIPIILTEQYPKGLGRTISVLKNLIPNIQPIEKVEFSCFKSVRFRDALEKTGSKSIIICGIETHICAMQTAIMGLGLGFRVLVVEDAVSSRNLNDKNIAIQRMLQKGVEIVTTEMLIYELLGKAGTKEFKKILEVVKE